MSTMPSLDDTVSVKDGSTATILYLVKNLIEQYSENRQTKNNFIETINMSIEEYDNGNTPDIYFIQDQKDYIKKYLKDTDHIDYNIEKICNQLDKYVSANESSDIISKPKTIYPKYKISYCLYDNHCVYCTEGASNKDQVADFCINCEICIIYRDLDKKERIKKAKEVYNTKIRPQNSIKSNTTNKVIDNPQSSITNNVTINNLYVQCDSFELNMEQPYFNSIDHIYYVTIQINKPSSEEMIKKLKYIFIYLMCGSNGKYLFPDEEKHSSSLTFPVSAALYTIKNIETKPILHGLLRYTKGTTTAMTTTKLQNLNQSSIVSKRPIIKADHTKDIHTIKPIKQ